MKSKDKNYRYLFNKKTGKLIMEGKRGKVRRFQKKQKDRNNFLLSRYSDFKETLYYKSLHKSKKQSKKVKVSLQTAPATA